MSKNINHANLIRQAHAVTNISSRIPKAKKIELLLGMQQKANDLPIRVLEIGCGSGAIAYYFATHKNLRCDVHAVDIHDNRVVFDHYEFIKVTDTILPFENQSFDIVISNHVIEHVGNNQEQLQHLKEIYRVLDQDGTCYLAAPNRWMLTEPHYNIFFLSWLPHSLRTPYLKMRNKGIFYDCEPPSLKSMETLLTEANFNFKNISIPALHILLELEQPNSLTHQIIKKIPDKVLNAFKPIIPTLIYKLKHDAN
ncbi:class I SAM-dependent methyltransferase [Acinetobacter cumulans]|uniref:class I SAM-dependent methyltransferase n=1 Tax=Acinetobacter cumulans TaxID=2136182 RepID=UPI000EA303EA|nr:class I SAM-dependent methyltransferase [Acinetobacter cumulans]RKG51428.1 class I SAM-dependent methyltransferase [Acinetobacter cumulans]